MMTPPLVLPEMRPGGSGSGSSGTKSAPWWVEIIYSYWNITQLNYPKVVQAAVKPTTGSRLTYIVIGVEGPFKTKADAATAAKNYSGIINVGGVGSGGPNLSGFLGGGGIGAVGDFFYRLTEPQTWARIAEVTVGGILIYIGLHATTQGTAAQSAAKSAAKPVKKVGKAAINTAKKRATPAPAQPLTRVQRTVRESHIYHHTQPKPPPKKVGP